MKSLVCLVFVSIAASAALADGHEYILVTRLRRGIGHGDGGYESHEESGSGGGGHSFEPITQHEVVNHYVIPKIKAVKVSVPHPIPVPVAQPVPVPVPVPQPIHIRVSRESGSTHRENGASSSRETLSGTCGETDTSSCREAISCYH
ncbi:hypothetical protein L9F63_020170 [Diploptera punctata]|uniref:Uncharacterized protein n=1 Tax=Diploptera punctata TaxID=6984 RepID=A0AAD7ZT70_DIPPU|nr:hypothetical protein L9F63_020170 [Diploptera punctata]